MFKKLKDNWLMIVGVAIVTAVSLKWLMGHKPDFAKKLGF